MSKSRKLALFFTIMIVFVAVSDLLFGFYPELLFKTEIERRAFSFYLTISTIICIFIVLPVAVMGWAGVDLDQPI